MKKLRAGGAMENRIPDMSRQPRQPIRAALHAMLYAALFLLLAAGAVLCSEAIWRGSFSEASMWASRLFGLFAVLSAAVAAAEAALYLITGRMALSVLIADVVIGLCAVTQHYKLTLRGEQFVISDVLLAREAAGILDKFAVDVPWYVILPCAALLALPVCCWGMRLRGRFLRRIAGAAVCAGLCIGCLAGVMRMTDAATTELSTYYHLNGVLAGLVWSRPQAMQKPEGYGEEAVRAALRGYEAQERGAAQDDAQQPDILFIMSESLYDLGKLEGFTVDGEMMPYTKALQAEHFGGELYVISYGGGTSLSEYEVLTGYRAEYTAVAPYLDQTRVYAGMDSIVTLLSAHGYHTSAMHPSIGETYNRENAYARLGFAQSIFIEDMDEVYDRVGPFPSDKYLFEEIIRQYEKRPVGKPWFSFVITYQNHGDYNYDYPRQDIGVYGEDGARLGEASTFANAVRASDEALRSLIAYFEAQERPVVIVLFGDHAPALSRIGYRETGEPEEQTAIHTTPLLVWSNYGLEMPEGMPRTLAAYRLGAAVLEAAGVTGDSYYAMLADPALPSLYGAAGQIIDEHGAREDASAAALEETMELLYYDRVYGENHSRAMDAGSGEGAR